VLTESAKKYIGAYAFKGVINGIVYSELFPHRRKLRGGEEHVEVARAAGCMVIAPATQSLISSLAYGDPKNPVSLVAMNIDPAKLLLCPAMSPRMWTHPATTENVRKLRDWGCEFIGPVDGRLASGDIGPGRMTEPDDVVAMVCAKLGRIGGDLRGLKIVVSAGGCRERIDAARFLGNRSSGKQGHAIAEAARDRGAEVVLITSVPGAAPVGVSKIVAVSDFESFKSAIASELKGGEIYISAAAISDFKPGSPVSGKLLRSGKSLSIELQPTEDLLSSIPASVFKVAFAAEASSAQAENVSRAKEKLKKKGAHLIVMNSIVATGAGFESENNRVIIIDPSGTELNFPAAEGELSDKLTIAHGILDQIRSAISANESKIASKKSS
jgi:phosphopantothenoylcysteine decarboxylase/phosphopantothenate--cysteine ligase